MRALCSVPNCIFLLKGEKKEREGEGEECFKKSLTEQTERGKNKTHKENGNENKSIERGKKGEKEKERERERERNLQAQIP